LAVEASFYAVLPLLAIALLAVHCRGKWRPFRLLVGLAMIAVISPVWLVVVNTTDWLPNSAGMWLPAHLAWFIGGMALATLQGMNVRLSAAAAMPLAVILFLVVCTPVAGGVTMGPVRLWEPLTKNLLYACVATLVAAPLVLGGGGWWERFLRSRPMTWLGEISYEVFLLHVLVMALVLGGLNWPLFSGSLPMLFGLTLAVTIPPAWALRRLDGLWRAGHPRTTRPLLLV
jgi:peptidoglycan/LPS O-acetylase OafA/YrhL